MATLIAVSGLQFLFRLPEMLERIPHVRLFLVPILPKRQGTGSEQQPYSNGYECRKICVLH
jgi:hypothetical protein